MSPLRVVVACACVCVVAACDPKEAPKPAPAASTPTPSTPTPAPSASPSPAPAPSPSPSPAPSTSTTPIQLCDRYVALSDPDKKLDEKARKDKHTRCTTRAEGMKTWAPATYACVVDCTLAAKDYAAARKCRRDCSALGKGGTEGGKGVLGGPPGGAGATGGGIKGAPSGSASALLDDDD